MKAKELLKTLCKSGMVDGSIFTGKAIIDANYQVLEGKIFPNKEYYYTFKELTLVNGRNHARSEEMDAIPLR